MKSHYKRGTCRLCDSKKLELVLPLSPIPAADRYVSLEEKNIPQELYPLDLYLCLDCGHAQLLDVVDPNILFHRNYLYVTSSSLGLVEHFKNYAADIARLYPFPKKSRVVEIGSNEGVLLNFFKELGFEVLGIDPAKSIAEKATKAGLETWAEFFNLKIAERVIRERGKAAIVAANNVFAHSDHLAEMAEGVQMILQSDGVFVFEVNYLGDLLQKRLFDIIYHEHLSFHSTKPLQKFLLRYGLELIRVDQISSKVGSLRCVAQLKGGPREVHASVGKILSFESSIHLDKPETFRSLAKEVRKIRSDLQGFIKPLVEKGKKIVGYGAAPNSTTLIYYFGLQNILKFIVDDNPIKQGRFSPGCHLPVYPSDFLMKEKPDYVIVLAWPYINPIIERNKKYQEQGGRFIAPLPELKVI